MKEITYGIPISPDFDVRVNLCGSCLNTKEYQRMVEAQLSGEGDDFYHFELHDKEVIANGE